jgi:solute carrier family 10 (sodium/bile acid cotransporter), member 7
MAMNLARFRPDNFTLCLLGTVALATVLPCRGWFAGVMETATTTAIVLLFFLHGAKLSREAILSGLGAWRLHLMVFASTFVLFPVLGMVVRAAPGWMIDPAIASGVLFLCLLPSTVQSSIAFTSIAGGNVPAAVCSASASSLIGIFLTPLLAGVLMGAHGRGGNEIKAVESVALELLAPFLVGHFSRPLIGRWVDGHKGLLSFVDRGSILLVVYTAFSAAVVQGLWRKLSAPDLVQVVVWDGILLAAALTATTLAARAFRFRRVDEITIVFCGSKKSLAAGVPMAGVLFPAAQVGLLIVPLMLFHQIQLMVCAVLARRYAAQADRGAPPIPAAMERAQP